MEPGLGKVRLKMGLVKRLLQQCGPDRIWASVGHRLGRRGREREVSWA